MVDFAESRPANSRVCEKAQMLVKAVLILAALVLIAEAILVAQEKDKLEMGFQVVCKETGVSVIVTPATANTLEQAKRLAECLGSEKSACTIETVRLTRKPIP